MQTLKATDTSPREPWSETELVERLQAGRLRLPPLQLRLPNAQTRTPGGSRPDGTLETLWDGCSRRFAFEYKSLSTPKAVETAIAQVRRHAQQKNLFPMIIVPFLSEERLAFLEQEGISGIDLCGNGVIVAPGLMVRRSGQPNLFKDSKPIKNIYRGSSSIFARCFLLRSQFPSLAQLRAFALDHLEPEWSSKFRDAKLVLSTASKVVQALEQDLIIVRERRHLRLIDPQRLLLRLRENFHQSESTRLEGKIPVSPGEAWIRLNDAMSKGMLRAITTGTGSAARYKVLSSVQKLSLYVTDLGAAAELLEVRPGRVFPTVELIQDKTDAVYFDARKEDAVFWASPIQVWLELMKGGPREREAAQVLEPPLAEGRAEELP